MIPDMAQILASFTDPINIPTDPKSMLWMFPLLLSISLVYKATKIRVIFIGRFFKDVGLLFATISVFMIFLGAALIFLVKLINE